MPRKKIVTSGSHTFYIPSGYLPLIWEFVRNTDIVCDKKLYLTKVLMFIDSLYIKLKHNKSRKAGFSVKRVHDLVGMNHSDCTKLLLSLQEHKIIFCDKRGFKPGEVPWSYGLVPLPEKHPGFDRVAVKKEHIRKSTLDSLYTYHTSNEDLQLYYDEVISKLEIRGIDMEKLTMPVYYDNITAHKELSCVTASNDKFSDCNSSIHFNGEIVPGISDHSNTTPDGQKTDGDLVPAVEIVGNNLSQDGEFVPGFPKNESYDISDTKNLIIQEGKKKKSPTTISSIHFSGDFVPDDFLSVSRVPDNKYLPLFRIHDKRFFCRPSYRNPEGRVYSNVTNLKKEFRKYLSIGGKHFIGTDICNCQPLLATILFMNYSMNVYGELKDDVLEYKSACEGGNEFYEYFMDLNQMEIDDNNRKVLKGKFFGECFYSKNPKKEKRKLLSKQFEEKYLTCYEALVEYKGGFDYSPKYKLVPVTLQAIEKSIVFDANIELLKAGIKCFNIFDSLYCTSMEDVEKAQAILTEKFQEWEIKPKFKIEDHAKNANKEALDSHVRAESANEYISLPVYVEALNEPENKPDWWQPLEYYENHYGPDGKEIYEGQFDLLHSRINNLA